MALARHEVAARLFPEGDDAPVRIDEFVILRHLGAGGMGVVYSAYDEKLDRKVALKFLRARLAPNRDARARLRREAKALARLSHPNVVTVHAVGDHPGGVYVAMEYVDGPTLREWQAQPRSVSEILEVYVQAGQGLAAAHRAGLVHRDFKPENVLVGCGEERNDRARARVMDFGLARADSATVPDDVSRTRDDLLSSPLTRDGAIAGTPAYMAPEQRDGGTVDARSDQYSFCVALWEALCGSRPVHADDSGSPTTGAKIPPALRRVLLRGLAHDPGDRHPTMNELLTLLQRDPGGMRRRRIALAGLAGLGVAAVVVLIARRAYAEAACEEATAEIDADWNAEVAEGIGETMGAAAGGESLAWQRLQPRLEAYARTWSQLRRRVCDEERIAGTRTSESAARSRDCLSEGRAQLSALLAVLREADAQTERFALKSAYALEPLESCLDEASLQQRLYPRDDAARRRVQALREELARSQVLKAAGRLEEARERARTVLHGAEAMAFPPLVARARLRIGWLDDLLGDHRAAADGLEAAYAGSTAVSDDAGAAEAASLLAFVHGQSLAQAERGLVWAQVGDALVRRLGAEEGLVAAAMHHGRAAALNTLNRYDEARAAWERALAIRKALLPAVHPDIASTRSNLGAIAFAAGDYATARLQFEDALAIYEAFLGSEHPDVATGLINLAQVEFMAGKYDAALGLAERARAVYVHTLGPNHPAVANTYETAGNVYKARGEYGQALEQAERVLQLRTATYGPEHVQVARAHHNVGTTQLSLGDKEASLSSLQRAIDVFEKTVGLEHVDPARSRDALGTVYRRLGRLDEALAAHEAAAAVQRKLLGPDNPILGETLYHIAYVHFDRGELDEAIDLFRDTLAIYEAAYGTEHPDVVGPLVAVAQTELARGHAEQSTAAAERAVAIVETHTVPTKLRGGAHFALARALWPTDPRRAIDLAQRAEAERRAAPPGTADLDEIRQWLEERR